MRTAALGDEGRLVIVRRVNLGRIPLRASATQWSQRLEQSFRESHPIPVSVHHPSAGEAPAIYFASSYEPWLILARRTASNVSCNEWYWPAALPSWRPTLNTIDTLRLCFRSLAAQGGLPLTLTLVRYLPTEGLFAPLLQSLRPEDLAAVEAELGFHAAAPTIPAGEPVRGKPTHPTSLRPFEKTFLATWGRNDLRTYWLAAATLLRLENAPVTPLSSTRPPTIHIRTIVAAWSSQETSTQSEPVSTRSTPPRVRPPADTPVHPAEIASPLPTEPSITPFDTAPLSEMSAAPERLFTRAGGLFFLVPLLVHANFPAFLETLPDENREPVPWALLKLALQHARIARADPLCVALEASPPCRLPLGRWLMAANRLSRQLCGLNLRQTISRPALVTLAPTHVDLFFRASEADVRIRRAALDLDPGWVPWLGRAISYHFNRED